MKRDIPIQRDRNALLGLWLLVMMIFAGCHHEKRTEPYGIVAMTPSLSEVVWAIDPDKLIATSPFTTDKRAEGLIRVQNEGSLETIVSLNPAIVLLHASDIQLADKLETMHISTLRHAMDTIEEIDETLDDIGKILKNKEKSDEVKANMHRQLAENRRRYAQSKPSEILIIVDRLDARMMQFYLSQNTSYIATLVGGCGFKTIALNDENWLRIESETLIQRDPEAILFLTRSPEDAREVRNQFERQYALLSAVKRDRVIYYDKPEITVPGPEIGSRQTTLCESLRVLVE